MINYLFHIFLLLLLLIYLFIHLEKKEEGKGRPHNAAGSISHAFHSISSKMTTKLTIRLKSMSNTLYSKTKAVSYARYGSEKKQKPFYFQQVFTFIKCFKT